MDDLAPPLCCSLKRRSKGEKTLMRPHNGPTLQVLVAVWLVSLGIMVFELVLTRVYSVTMWYHFAFMALSVAMLGLSAGAMLIHRAGMRRDADALMASFPTLCILFGVLAIVGTACVLRFKLSLTFSLRGLLQLAAVYVLSAAPFVAGGAALAIVVRKHGASMSSVYFADLTGAAMGCAVVIPLLRLLGGPESVYAAVISLGLASIIMAKKQRRIIFFLALMVVSLLFSFNNQLGLLKIVWAKQRGEKGILYDSWNSFSRVTVFPTEEEWNTQFFAWGMSPVYDGPLPHQLGMHIDAYAGTPITEFTGDYRELDHLSYDVTSLAYRLRPYGTHLVIGPGGGRDILASLAAGADSVVAVEVNPAVVTAVNVRFGDFSHRPYSLGRVEPVVAEARSFLRREKRTFDVIQASLVDTWAATAAGAYTLSENTLYTVEAMTDYLGHLADDGLISISRFLFDPPRETLRLFSVALHALDAAGSLDPSQHIAVVACRGVATVLVSKQELQSCDTEALQTISDSLAYVVVYLPGAENNPVFDRLAHEFRTRVFYDAYLFDVSPSTDNRPFFFNMIKPADFLKVFRLNDLDGQTHSYDAVFVLMALLGIATLLTCLLIVWPAATLSRGAGRSGLVFAFYFVFIGLGFMLAEVTLLQKLVLFLGHPVYSLSVVLLGLLLFGGMGSLATRRICSGREAPWIIGAGFYLAIVFVIARSYLDAPLVFFLGSSKTMRVIIALSLLFPAGLIMGTLLPLGMRVAARWQKESTPWLWGVNGAASVLGSVLAFALAMNFGFRMTFFLAACCYALASLLFVSVLGRIARA
jgi:hypothetical protein